jgi:hypothetical protein
MFAAGSLAAQSTSPFLPPTAPNAAAAATAGAPLQYRGFSETSEGVKFRIVDPAKKSGTWLKLNERDTTFDVTVKQSVPDYATIVVEHQGRTLNLALPEAKVNSSGPAGAHVPIAPPPQMVNVPPAVTQSVVVNPSPADEQRRLESVATEVARRRALREQAQQQPQGAPPPVPQMGPQGFAPQGMQPNPPNPQRPRGN